VTALPQSALWFGAPGPNDDHFASHAAKLLKKKREDFNMATVGFQANIKPFFTPCYRSHMLAVSGLDLWDAGQVQGSWDDINSEVTSGSMPKAGCPEGVWDKTTKALFLSEFLAWKNGGFQP
jgi:hypothetical protein